MSFGAATQPVGVSADPARAVRLRSRDGAAHLLDCTVGQRQLDLAQLDVHTAVAVRKADHRADGHVRAGQDRTCERHRIGLDAHRGHIRPAVRSDGQPSASSPSVRVGWSSEWSIILAISRKDSVIWQFLMRPFSSSYCRQLCAFGNSHMTCRQAHRPERLQLRHLPSLGAQDLPWLIPRSAPERHSRGCRTSKSAKTSKYWLYQASTSCAIITVPTATYNAIFGISFPIQSNSLESKGG